MSSALRKSPFIYDFAMTEPIPLKPPGSYGTLMSISYRTRLTASRDEVTQVRTLVVPLDPSERGSLLMVGNLDTSIQRH